MSQFRFGTPGWRGIIARDFTFDNVRVASQGIAQHFRAELPNPESPLYECRPVVVIGRDTRFLCLELSLSVAEVLTANGLELLRCDRDTPTPAIAHSIRARKSIGGINMTASHNSLNFGIAVRFWSGHIQNQTPISRFEIEFCD